MENKNETFNYTYSSKQQEELRSIRQRYIHKEENKMEQLKSLDQKATRPGTVVSMAIGIVSALVLGIGMSLTMIWADTLFIPGIVIGIVGIIGVCITYPLYRKITKKERNKVASTIMHLSDELLLQK